MCAVKSASLDELQESMWSSRHSDWDDTFRVNVTAHYFLSVALLKLLAAASNLDLGDGRKGKDEGRGVMIITSSCASKVPPRRKTVPFLEELFPLSLL